MAEPLNLPESITWHRDPTDLPDCDTTVLLELDPAFDYSEPVFMGYRDADCWRDVHGELVEIVAWADVPVGTRGMAQVAQQRLYLLSPTLDIFAGVVPK